jgi:DNA topoisomerase-1
LDSVEGGEHSWVDVLREFWVPFKEQLEKVEADVERLEVKDEPAGEDCDKCGRPMVIKRGRFGRFIACSGYPECKNTKPILEKTGVICPKCQKDIVARRSKRGKVFYGCSGYPDCDFVVWQKPVVGSACPHCGSFLVESKGKAKKYQCPNENCPSHTQNL